MLGTEGIDRLESPWPRRNADAGRSEQLQIKSSVFAARGQAEGSWRLNLLQMEFWWGYDYDDYDEENNDFVAPLEPNDMWHILTACDDHIDWA